MWNLFQSQDNAKNNQNHDRVIFPELAVSHPKATRQRVIFFSAESTLVKFQNTVTSFA